MNLIPNFKKNNGQVMLVSVLFFISFFMLVITGFANSLVAHIRMANSIALSKNSYYAAEAGAEDAVFRLRSGLPVAASQTISLGANSVQTSVTDVLNGKEIVAAGDAQGYVRRVKVNLVLGNGIAFHYGIQAGAGGFYLYNSSSVTGNIHSSGPVVGAGNFIDGDVISAGPAGVIDHIHASGTVFAHTVNNSIVNKDAFYNEIHNTTVSGALHPASPDQPLAPLPISDEQIADWEAAAEAGGVIDASHCVGGILNITSSTVLGPVKIECNLNIKGNGIIVTMAGHVWVAGNITTQNGPIIRISPALGNQNVAMIADNQANRSGSGIITIGQNSSFQHSGAANSFVFMISQNNNSEMGGSNDAFVMGQSSGALITYASHGQITLGQSVGVKEATAYKIVLRNTANVTYDTGLPSTLFQSGPTGGFDILGWREIQ